jgi:hypothetical protein
MDLLVGLSDLWTLWLALETSRVWSLHSGMVPRWAKAARGGSSVELKHGETVDELVRKR